jgi:hypothetical protein
LVARQAGDGLASFGNDHFFAVHHALQQLGEMGLGFVDIYLDGHASPPAPVIN